MLSDSTDRHQRRDILNHNQLVPMPDPNRVRDNQRRSRARRKEYLQATKQRLQDFERAGVAASAEIQVAARKVVEENVLLRSLLRLHGVTDAEISEHLRNSSDGASSGRSVSIDTPETSIVQSLACTLEKSFERLTHVQDSSERLASSAATEPHQEAISQPARPSVTLPSGVESSNSYGGEPSPLPVESYEDARPNEVDNLTNHNAALRDQSHAAPAANHPPLPQADNTTSCLLAATILAGMGCAKTVEEVTAELGCSAEADCRVDNMTLFRIMDS